MEECVAPPSLNLLGSGGRAALALDGFETVELHTFHPDEADILANFGSRSVVHRSAASIRFRYLHSLSRPEIEGIPRQQVPSVRLSTGKALCFGCIEGDFVIEATGAVYDPQGGNRSFRANGSSAERLAVVLNEREAWAITGLVDPLAAASALMELDGAEVVVIKRGPIGAMVLDRSHVRPSEIPAFRTARVSKIGSGDVFSAMFCHYWLTGGATATEAAELASRQVADYVTTRILPRPAQLPGMEAVHLRDAPSRIAVAGDLDTTAGLWLVSEAMEALASLGVRQVRRVAPHPGEGMDATLEGCNAILVLPTTATGMALEAARCGRSMGLPCTGFAETPELHEALLQAGACAVGDFAASVYSTMWAIA